MRVLRLLPLLAFLTAVTAFAAIGALLTIRTLAPGVLPGGAVRLAPGDGSPAWLEFRDPGRAQPIRVDLGRLPAASEGAASGAEDAAPGGGHRHH